LIRAVVVCRLNNVRPQLGQATESVLINAPIRRLLFAGRLFLPRDPTGID
jgi:hypothetical protein